MHNDEFNYAKVADWVNVQSFNVFGIQSSKGGIFTISGLIDIQNVSHLSENTKLNRNDIHDPVYKEQNNPSIHLAIYYNNLNRKLVLIFS